MDSSVINQQPVKLLKFKSNESDDSIIQSSSDDDVKIDEATSTDLQKKNIFVTFAKFNLKLLRKKINTSLNKNTVKTSSVLKQSFLSVMI